MCWEMAWILRTKHLFSHTEGSLTCRKILHRTDGFISPPKEVVLRIFIAIKNPLSLKQRTLGPIASTLTTRLPRATRSVIGPVFSSAGSISIIRNWKQWDKGKCLTQNRPSVEWCLLHNSSMGQYHIHYHRRKTRKSCPSGVESRNVNSYLQMHNKSVKLQ
jgi:hypothetical protein